MQSFTTAQATRITGFRSPMMVDYLCRTGIVTPSIRPRPGHGRARLYRFGDLVLLRAVRRLLESGVSVSKLRQGLSIQQKKFRQLGPTTKIAKYLITDGKNVLLADNASSLIELNKDGQLAFAFIVDVAQARTDVSGEIVRLGRSKAEFPKSIRQSGIIKTVEKVPRARE